MSCSVTFSLSVLCALFCLHFVPVVRPVIDDNLYVQAPCRTDTYSSLAMDQHRESLLASYYDRSFPYLMSVLRHAFAVWLHTFPQVLAAKTAREKSDAQTDFANMFQAHVGMEPPPPPAHPPDRPRTLYEEQYAQLLHERKVAWTSSPTVSPVWSSSSSGAPVCPLPPPSPPPPPPPPPPLWKMAF